MLPFPMLLFPDHHTIVLSNFTVMSSKLPAAWLCSWGEVSYKVYQSCEYQCTRHSLHINHYKYPYLSCCSWHIPYSHLAACTNGELHLAGGNIANEGRVEICVNNAWGTCVMTPGEVQMLQLFANSWDILLKVRNKSIYNAWKKQKQSHICYSTISSTSGALAFCGAHFGTGAGPIHLDDVACSGSESNLTDCSYSLTVTCTNGHSQDAGVRCQG